MFLDKRTLLMLLVLASLVVGFGYAQVDDEDGDEIIDVTPGTEQGGAAATDGEGDEIIDVTPEEEFGGVARDEDEAADEDEEGDILGALEDAGATTFADLITRLDIVDELNGGGTVDTQWVGGPGGGPYTIFAPRNDAFDMIDDNDLDDLLDNEDDLGTIVDNHIIDGTDLLGMGDADVEEETIVDGDGGDEAGEPEGVDLTDRDDTIADEDDMDAADDTWPREMTIGTLGDDIDVMVDEDGDVVSVEGADIVRGPINYGNGNLYVIDRLLLPDDEDLLDEYNLGDIDWDA